MRGGNLSRTSSQGGASDDKFQAAEEFERWLTTKNAVGGAGEGRRGRWK